MTPSPMLGEWLCLASAGLWAIAVAMFRGPIERFGPKRVNLAKCALATILQGATVVALGQTESLLSASPLALGSLAASGLIGLVLGDTALFAAVGRLGVHRALLLQTLAPVFAALAAWAWLGELPTRGEWVGASVILLGIGLVVSPDKRVLIQQSWPLTGLLLATFAAFGQGAGLVLAKAGMEEIAPLPASSFRLGVAAIGLAIWLGFAGRRSLGGAFWREAALKSGIVPATVLGTYLAMFLLMMGLEMARTSVAAVLLATTPIFSLGIEWVVHRRRPTLRAAIGTLIAVAGVSLLRAR